MVEVLEHPGVVGQMEGVVAAWGARADVDWSDRAVVGAAQGRGERGDRGCALEGTVVLDAHPGPPCSAVNVDAIEDEGALGDVVQPDMVRAPRARTVARARAWMRVMGSLSAGPRSLAPFARRTWTHHGRDRSIMW